jgi:hypothetical protein
MVTYTIRENLKAVDLHLVRPDGVRLVHLTLTLKELCNLRSGLNEVIYNFSALLDTQGEQTDAKNATSVST